MNFDSIKKIQDMDLKNKKVLVRVDYNVPLKDGKVDNNKRIVATEKTIKYLLENNCRIVLICNIPFSCAADPYIAFGRFTYSIFVAP